MLLGREFSSHLRRYPREKARLQWRGAGFRTSPLGLRDRFRRLGDARTAFHVGLRHPAAKVAVVVFVVLDLILVYRLTVNDSPALVTSVPGKGASSANRTTFDELRKALGDLNDKVSALKLFGGDASRGTRPSTNQSGGGTSQVSSTSGGSPTGSGGSATSSGSGSSSTGSGSGGSSTGSSGSSTGGGGPGGGGLPGGGSGGGGTGSGGGGGGGGG